MFILKQKLEDSQNVLPKWVFLIASCSLVCRIFILLNWNYVSSFRLTSSSPLSGLISRFSSDPQISDVSGIWTFYSKLCSYFSFKINKISHLIFLPQFEEYQQKLDYSVNRMAKNLKTTRAFWEKGISFAIQNRPKSDNTTVDEDSIDNSPRVEVK